MAQESETQKNSVPTVSKLNAKDLIISKIEVIEEYCETKQARFELPRRGAFSLNWFTDFAGVHKTNKLIKKNGEFRSRLDQALKDAGIQSNCEVRSVAADRDRETKTQKCRV